MEGNIIGLNNNGLSHCFGKGETNLIFFSFRFSELNYLNDKLVPNYESKIHCECLPVT